MVDCGFYLGVHDLFHLSLGISPIAAQGHKKHEGKDQKDAEDMMGLVPIVEVDDSCFNIVADIIGLKHCLALLRGINEARANGIEDGLGLELTTEGAIVDHDRWEKV